MTLSTNRNLLAYGIPLGLFALLVVIIQSALFEQSSILPFAVSVDLVITVPFVYFLLIRRTAIPKTTVVPVMVVGLMLGTYLLPQEDQTYLALFKTWVFPVVELSVVSYVVYTLRKVAKEHRKRGVENTDFFTDLKEASAKVLPRPVVIPFATEIAVFYYGFVYRKKISLKDNEFTYHRSSGTIALLATIIFVVGIEASVFHILLTRWSETLAWIMTLLSLYSALQLFGFLRSMTKRLIVIDNGCLYLRYGIMSEATIGLSDIESVEISHEELSIDEQTRRLSPLGELESHNVIIYLNKENTLERLYGMRKKFTTLALYVDNPAAFKRYVDAKKG